MQVCVCVAGVGWGGVLVRGQSSPVCCSTTFFAFLLQTQYTIGIGSKQLVVAAMTHAQLSLSFAIKHLTGRVFSRAGQEPSTASGPHSSQLDQY